MKLRIFSLLAFILVIVSCQSEKKDHKFLLSPERVGDLTKEIRVNQLDSIFSADSVVTKEDVNMFSEKNEVVVYNKEGKEMLRLQPVKALDDASTIGLVQVMDTLYKTKEGVGRGSAFGLVKTHYNISRIENTLGTAMVFLDEINMYMTIDKRDILEPTDMGAKIKASQIQDEAKIKHLWVKWK